MVVLAELGLLKLQDNLQVTGRATGREFAQGELIVFYVSSNFLLGKVSDTHARRFPQVLQLGREPVTIYHSAVLASRL